MSILVSAFTVAVGGTRRLEVAQGEDREYRLAFQQSGTAFDMTGATTIVLSVKNRGTNDEVFSRAYSGFQNGATGGTPRFQVLSADTTTQGDGPYDCDVVLTDSGNLKTQLMGVSTFEILRGVGDEGDAVTTPPAIPVVFGLNWHTGLWSAISGGYQINDSVAAHDGSLGATAVSTFRAIIGGVTYYPIGPTQVLNTGWNYIGQHGGVGATGVAGATGPGVTQVYVDAQDSVFFQQAEGQALVANVVATGNIGMSGAATIDGLAVDNNWLVLAAGQSNKVRNGVYLADLGDAWQRIGFPTGYFIDGRICHVKQGNGQSGSIWRSISSGTSRAVAATTPVDWVKLQ